MILANGGFAKGFNFDAGTADVNGSGILVNDVSVVLEATPDFDGNGISDLVLTYGVSDNHGVLLEDSGDFVSIADQGPLPSVEGYIPAYYPNLDGLYGSDLVLWDPTTNLYYAYLMNGLTVLDHGPLASPPVGYLTTGWISASSDPVRLPKHLVTLVSNGFTFAADASSSFGGYPLPNIGSDCMPTGTPDFDGDGNPDYAVECNSTASLGGSFNYGWLMDSDFSPIDGGAALPSYGGMVTAGFPDFGGSGGADMVLTHESGYLHGFIMTGLSASAGVQVPGAPPGYEVSGSPDINCDGKGDIAIENIADQYRHVYLMEEIAGEPSEISNAPLPNSSGYSAIGWSEPWLQGMGN